MMWGKPRHYVGDWPHSRQVLDEMFDGAPEDERYQITCGNALEFFHLDTERADSSSDATAVAQTA